jgi:hypothetical protein
MNAQRLRGVLFVTVPALLLEVAWAAEGPAGRNAVPTESPMSDYTVSVVVQVLLIGVLVSVLLIGGILALNLGMLSKRPEDRIGGRTPSDVGFLKETNWPEEPSTRSTLPAQEDETEGVRIPGLSRLKRRKGPDRVA